MSDQNKEDLNSEAVPFFARFLEGQSAEEMSEEEMEAVKGGGDAMTMKYPSDQEDGGVVTRKYPSDGDDYDVTQKYPSDSDEGGV
jgi:hypothetical protein